MQSNYTQLIHSRTGATGYIGGSVLEGVQRQFPALQIVALLRSPSEEFRSRYPKIEIVQGNFDAFDLIENTAASADIVIRKKCRPFGTPSVLLTPQPADAGDHNHAGCGAAILAGLKKKTTPSFLIHLTGTGCISDEREQTWKGEHNPHTWDDIKDIKKIYDLPESAKHHIMDKKIMDASNGLLKTACVCPPDIYGQSTGAGSRATYMVPEYVKYAMENKEAFYLGKGQNVRAVTHINDVVDLFVILVDQAIQGGGSAQWGKEVRTLQVAPSESRLTCIQGFYFAVADEVKWIEAAEAINKIGVEHGWFPADSKPVSWTEAQFAGLMKHIPIPGLALYIWGSNSRATSSRAAKLGWKPHGPSFWDSLEEDVSVAVAKLRA